MGHWSPPHPLQEGPYPPPARCELWSPKYQALVSLLPAQGLVQEKECRFQMVEQGLFCVRGSLGTQGLGSPPWRFDQGTQIPLHKKQYIFLQGFHIITFVCKVLLACWVPKMISIEQDFYPSFQIQNLQSKICSVWLSM